VKKHTRLNAECYNPLKIPRPARAVNAFERVSNDFQRFHGPSAIPGGPIRDIGTVIWHIHLNLPILILYALPISGYAGVVLKEKIFPMKRVSLVSLLVVFVLMITPLAVMAQDNPDNQVKLEDFVSQDETLTVGYPEGWIIQENDVNVTGTPGVMIANSEEALTAMTSTESESNLAEGQSGIAVLLLPVDLLGFMGIEVPAAGEPLDILTVADGFFASTMGSGADTTADISKAEELPLSDEVTAGYIKIKDATIEGAMIVFELKPGVLAIVFGGTYPGEFNDEFNNTLTAIAQSLGYTGTGDDLMSILMGAGSSSTGDEGTTPEATATPEDTGTSSDNTGSTLDGAALVQERCTVCHTTARIDRQNLDEAGWTQIVNQMIGFGAQLNDQEKAAVIAYLTETH
jgi:hypothetical protein